LFYGPPGTGKTYHAKNLAEEFTFKQKQDFEKVIPEVRYQPDFVDSMSDDEYKEFVINSIKKESEKRKFTFTEINTYGQYSIEKNGQQFHLDFHYSASATQDPDDSYVGISQANIDFFNQVPIENRFIVIVNHSHKNFVVLPYSIEQNHAKFSDSSAGNWDPSGKNAHSFHVEIKKDECKFKGTNYDCKKFLRNVGMIFGQFIRRVTFHPSYSYEEFVEGIRPNLDSDQISYKLEHGIFKEICRQAEFDPKNRYVLLIDEINRGNIPKIFGELITLIEDEKREVYSLNLTYSKELFTVPKNLYIIGTMNTADQSISHLDTALRRRFSHEELMPKGDLIDNTIDHNGKKINLKDVLEKINAKIRKDAGRERQIGHSYFMKNDEAISEIVLLRDRFKSKIIPLIQDYFYEDMNKVHKILGEDFIDKTEETVKEKTLDDLDAFADAVNAI
jgi:5-methylcytosine-specific restriction protein B